MTAAFNRERSRLSMSNHTSSSPLMDHDTLIMLDEAGNACDCQGLPLPLSKAIEIRNRMNIAIDKATPRSLADLHNRRLLDRGEHYLDQFSVKPEHMA